LDPPSPPTDGIRSLGREDIDNIMPGRSPAVLCKKSKIETNMVIVGGYSRGAGSKEAGIAKGSGRLQGRCGFMRRNNRKGYAATREATMSVWKDNSKMVSSASKGSGQRHTSLPDGDQLSYFRIETQDYADET
jgi:hypothetical protein